MEAELKRPTVAEVKAWSKAHGLGDLDEIYRDLLTGEPRQRFTDEDIQRWIDEGWA